MYKLFIDETLPLVDELFTLPQFELSFFNKKPERLHQNVDAVICRAHTKINKFFFNEFTATLVATASSGSDHIDKTWLAEKNIHWVDAIGCNARSVSDYILHLLFHKYIQLTGNKVGIIGIGHVGSTLNQALRALGFETVLYDPPRAEIDTNFFSAELNELFECDVISLHVPLNKSGPHKTENFIDEVFLNNCKNSCLLINASRGEVLDETAIFNAPHIRFCLDVYKNEPDINPAIIAHTLISTPHIAGHAIEAKQRAMVIIQKKLCDFFDVKPTPHPLSMLLKPYNKPLKSPIDFDYDPFQETASLKETFNAETFIQLRKQHTFRHEL